jgi:predicted O-linked N-acetylglucosamine transferase (SPINDLY family)
LINAGLPEFVAEDQEGYVRLAVKWAGRLSELAELRVRLRGQVKESALCDADAFAMSFLNLMWLEWNERTARRTE